MIGPLLRRGTISVTAGTPVAGTRTPPWFTEYDWGMGIKGSRRPWKRVLRPLGDFGSGTTVSWYTSVTSSGFTVAPQATLRLCPTITSGVPGKLLPIASKSGARRCTG